MKAKLLFIILFSVLSSAIYASDLRGDTIDIRSYKISLDLSNFTTKILTGNAQIGIRAKMNGVQGIHLDMLALNVDSVKVNAAATSFNYNDSVIDINFPALLNNGDSATLQVYYHGHPLQQVGDFGGFYWTNVYAFNIGVSFLADPHNYGRVWFPCFDNFTQRSYFEYYITTRNNHKAFCNGLLLGTATSGSNKIWHWKIDEDIPSYLASVAVSDYQTLMDTVEGMNGIIPIQLAARTGDTVALKAGFVHLHNAFHNLEEHWGPYRWDRVGYAIVPFNAGAMEHATNIGFMQYYLNIAIRDCETTMAHELSHHWFGDLVTCDNAAEMWLNEGWATYNQTLFIENLYGVDSARLYQRTNHEKVLHKAHIDDEGYLPVSGVPSAQTYGTTVYEKGSDVIHTLRYYMGDNNFFGCVKSYLNTYAFNTASTLQLRDHLTQCWGNGLNDYFSDWVQAPGFTHLSLEQLHITPEQGAGTSVYFVIRQRLSHAPHYYNNMPVKVSYFDDKFNRVDETVYVSGACTSHASQLFTSIIPTYIAIDFDEKLQDAITDEWQFIADTGSYDFGTAKIILQVNAAPDSNLVRVEHNWLRPEPMHNKIAGIHLHDNRYWAVDGIIKPGFKANATVAYDGTDVSLDSTFFINSEDSLLIMYRANSDSEWVMADSFSINTQANNTDRIGEMTIYNLKKGQYTFAIRNGNVIDTSIAETACVFTDIAETSIAKNDFEIYPNPTAQNVSIAFEKNIFDTIDIFDLSGKKTMEQKIAAGQNYLEIKLKNFAAGTYVVTLTDRKGNRTSKKLIKQ